MSDYLPDDQEPEIPDGPAAAQILPWLRCNLPPAVLGALTGQDIDALRAAAQIFPLYQRTGDASLLLAFSACVRQMQRKTREFAYHAIAQVANWDDRANWWAAAKLWDHCDFRPDTAWICKYEPRRARG